LADLAAELERRRGRAPEPGEVFVLPETAELPVEWALLERHPMRRDLWLAVPADVQPLAGSGDVAVPAEALSGPLVLRCGHWVWIGASRLRPELRTGLLDAERLDAARTLQRALADGCLEPTPLGEENDRDPELLAWEQDVLRPARAALEALHDAVETLRPRRTLPDRVRRVSPWLAAALLLVSVGLGWWVARLERDLTAPSYDEPTVPFDFGEVRGDVVVKLAQGPGRVRIRATIPAKLYSEGPLRLALIRQGRIIAVAPAQEVGSSGERSITLQRNDLPPGPYSLEFRRAKDGKVLEEQRFRIETEETPGP